MADVSGKTSNGFAYEGDYQLPSAGRVHWSVTFRHDGDFAGIRHGCVHDMQDVVDAALEDAVKCDIESVWTSSR
ncbi:MAG TPA: TonB-dependent receptor [Rhodanobacter sp.]|nr:TonB-dependent receptor [Rhodanobacter sp.]